MRALSWLLSKNVSGCRMRYLVEWVVLGDENAERAFASASAASGLLPCAGDGSGVSGQDGRVKASDVDSKLHGGCGGQSEQPALEEVALDAASAGLRQVAGAVRGDALGDDGMGRPELVAGVHVEELGLAPAADEGHGAGVALEKLDEYLDGLGVGGAAGAWRGLSWEGSRRRSPCRRRVSRRSPRPRRGVRPDARRARRGWRWWPSRG